jgi:hypothetical protein
VLHRLVLRRRRRPCAGKEEVVVERIDPDLHVRAVGESGLPELEVVGGGRLVVAPSLEKQDRPVKAGGDADGVVRAQVQPVWGRSAEGQQARGRRGGKAGAVDEPRLLAQRFDGGLRRGGGFGVE